MSDQTCDRVAERIALGEPLAELAEHAATCARCGVATALPARLGGTHAAVDPGLGFAARMTAGAQQRIAVRKRRRIASSAVAAVAACALGAAAITHETREPAVAVAPVAPPATHASDDQAMANPDPANPANPANPVDPWRPAVPAAVDPDVRALVHLADIDRDLRGTARWSRIEKPLRPYRSLVQGVKP